MLSRLWRASPWSATSTRIRLYRGQRLATIATSATTAHLLERCPLVVLTVEKENEPAVRIYQRLGYETQCTLHETPLIRKEPVGAVSFVRRVLRRLAGKGREEGGSPRMTGLWHFSESRWTVIPSSRGGAERYRGGGEESPRLPYRESLLQTRCSCKRLSVERQAHD